MVAQVDRKFLSARPGKIWSRLVAYFLFEGRPLTTRGRWINPLVFAGYRLWAVLPSGHREIRPVFILGTGRSGTTVLGTILGLHRDVGYLNEPKALWQAALGDDDLIGSYSQTPGRYRMTGSDAGPDKVRRLHKSYRAFLRLSLSSRVVDKYPELIFRDGLLDAAFPDARKIVLIRNGADTVQSIEKWSRRHGTSNRRGRSDWWGRDRRKWDLLVAQLVAPDPHFKDALPQISRLTNHVDMAAVEWIVTMREALRLKAAGASGLLFIHHEDLVLRPKETLQEILDFCDLPLDQKMMTYGAAVLRPRPPHTRPDLDPCILPFFQETMIALGYGETD